jgi:quinoprotein dehydrogenase-associated probable ABC transporter substrate-binding protein
MRQRKLLLWLLVSVMTAGVGVPGTQGVELKALRVCADPYNLPFSNRQEEGFENRIATLVARELGVPLTYTWWPQRRGFLRGTLNARRCDAVIGIPTEHPLVLTTSTYYSSPYVVVSRRQDGRQIASLDDPVLKQIRIGVYRNSPIDFVFGRRGIVENVIGYSTFYDGQTNYPRRIIEDVAYGRIDVAIVWGPAAGYFVQQQADVLKLAPLEVSQLDGNGGDEPQVFAMSMGVRKTDEPLHAALDAVLKARRDEIRQILQHYGVPLDARAPDQ